MADITGYLNVIKNAANGELVRNAIIDCMKEINADGPLKKASLVITSDKNTTYKPGKGKAFTSVTVNIDSSGESDPNKTYTYEPLTIDSPENKTYTPPENTMYNSVEVAIPWDNENAHLAEEGHMTYYNVDEATGQKYWDASSAGTGADYVKRVWIDTDIKGLPNAGGSGGGGTGPWTVTFLDQYGGKVIGTVRNIPNGAGASAGDDTVPNVPTKNGKSGSWSSNINAVYNNMTVYPVYKGVSGDGPISWEDMLKDKGSSAPIGSLCEYTPTESITFPERTIRSNAAFVYDGTTKVGPYSITIPEQTIQVAPITFMKVASGEKGSVSTWLAVDPLRFTGGSSTYIDVITYSNGQSINDKDHPGDEDYPTSVFNTFMNWYLADMFDPVTRQSFRMVEKNMYGYSNTNVSVADVREMGYKTSEKKMNMQIWLPSMGELYSMVKNACDNERKSGTIANAEPHIFTPEPNSIDYYEAGWRPNGLTNSKKYIVTRSCTWWSQNSYAYPTSKTIDCDELDDGQPVLTAIELDTARNLKVQLDSMSSSDYLLYIGFCLG